MRAVSSPELLAAHDWVPVGPIRERFLRSGMSLSELARRLGWLWDGRADSTRVARMLGLQPYNPSNGCPTRTREFVAYRTAFAVAEALDIDPFEVGDMSDQLAIFFGMTVPIDDFLDWEEDNCRCEGVCSCQLPWCEEAG